MDQDHIRIIGRPPCRTDFCGTYNRKRKLWGGKLLNRCQENRARKQYKGGFRVASADQHVFVPLAAHLKRSGV